MNVTNSVEKGNNMAKAGKTTFEEGTRVKIVVSTNDLLIGIVGKITRPICDRDDHLASLYDIESKLLDNGCQLALTIDDVFESIE